MVLDSVTFHFRQDWPDAAQRSRLLTGMAAALMAVAERRQVAVVYINQVGSCTITMLYRVDVEMSVLPHCVLALYLSQSSTRWGRQRAAVGATGQTGAAGA